jgi:hypothetical protein
MANNTDAPNVEAPLLKLALSEAAVASGSAPAPLGTDAMEVSKDLELAALPANGFFLLMHGLPVVAFALTKVSQKLGVSFGSMAEVVTVAFLSCASTLGSGAGLSVLVERPVVLGASSLVAAGASEADFDLLGFGSISALASGLLASGRVVDKMAPLPKLRVGVIFAAVSWT